MSKEYSDNVAIIPLNPRGALELGLYPCKYCDMGWGLFTKDKVKSCHDECIYLKEWAEKQSK